DAASCVQKNYKTFVRNRARKRQLSGRVDGRSIRSDEVIAVGHDIARTCDPYKSPAGKQEDPSASGGKIGCERDTAIIADHRSESGVGSCKPKSSAAGRRSAGSG